MPLTFVPTPTVQSVVDERRDFTIKSNAHFLLRSTNSPERIPSDPTRWRYWGNGDAINVIRARCPSRFTSIFDLSITPRFQPQYPYDSRYASLKLTATTAVNRKTAEIFHVSGWNEALTVESSPSDVMTTSAYTYSISYNYNGNTSRNLLQFFIQLNY